MLERKEEMQKKNKKTYKEHICTTFTSFLRVMYKSHDFTFFANYACVVVFAPHPFSSYKLGDRDTEGMLAGRVINVC